MIRIRLAALTVLLGLGSLSACGGGSSSATGPTTPTAGFVLANLRVSPMTAHGLTFTADFTDPGGTVAGGTCNGASNLGELSLPVTVLSITGTTSTHGTLQCQVQFNAGSGTGVSGTFSVTDPLGNLSNALAFSAVLPEASAGRPGP